jgi:TPP-dependent trihydroxycyclohexane-1,2-dione (THcHDO) dehydratase
LQQLQHPVEADATVNDAFRPVSRFFDRINRPEQLLTALPTAMRVLTDPADTGAVVLSLPQDIQSHAFDFPAELFAEHDWPIRRPLPDPDEVNAVARLLADARKPVIIAGGGVIYADATPELEDLAASAGRHPGGRDHGRQGCGAAARLVAARRDRPGRHSGEQQPQLDGDYLQVDLLEVAHGLGARAIRATTTDEVRAALDETRSHEGPVVIVVPVIPHADLPGGGAWWDVAPSEVSEDQTVQQLRGEYEGGLASQRWFG